MFQINGDFVGTGYNPFIIAELSANHGGSIERAKASIAAAKNAGASAVKIQSYTPDTMTMKSSKEDFLIPEGLWKGYNLYDLYQAAYTPYEWHSELFAFAKQINVTLFSTPFDETAVDLLERLNTPAIKIASFELTDLPLIEYAARLKKPMFMSTGMATLEEIAEAVESCKKAGCKDLLLFHCISNYPADLSDAQLNNILALKQEFNVEVGLSDHTTSNLASIIAVSMGAVAIEKHFKLDDEDCGPDASFSILPDQLKSLVEDCSFARHALGKPDFSRPKTEASNKRFRRSLYFCKPLKAGHVITDADIRRIRPGFGLDPKFFKDVIGLKLANSVEAADPVKWEHFESKNLPNRRP
ncbi:pseudaminic acid synthase [Alphaproteobacteria bacterium LSUCC0719]